MDLNQLNDYGVPLHACNGYICDEHYWAWLRHLRADLGMSVADIARLFKPEDECEQH